MSVYLECKSSSLKLEKKPPAQGVPQQHQAILCKWAQGKCSSASQKKKKKPSTICVSFTRSHAVSCNRAGLAVPWPPWTSMSRHNNQSPFINCQCLPLVMFSSLYRIFSSTQRSLIHGQLILVKVEFVMSMKKVVHPPFSAGVGRPGNMT